MQITLLGATGPTGQQILEQALAAGHRVTVLVRDPSRLPQRDQSGVTVVTGDATRVDDVKRALTGSQAALSALGSGGKFKSDIASRSVRALIPAAEETGVRRVVVLSAFGVGETLRHYKVVQRAGVMLVMKDQFADKAAADGEIRASGLDWTLVYPTMLTKGAYTGTYTVRDVPTGTDTVGGRISRADVADFMLLQAGSEEWSRRTAVLTH